MSDSEREKADGGEEKCDTERKGLIGKISRGEKIISEREK